MCLLAIPPVIVVIAPGTMTRLEGRQISLKRGYTIIGTSILAVVLIAANALSLAAGTPGLLVYCAVYAVGMVMSVVLTGTQILRSIE